MSDRAKAFVVVLEEDLSEEESEATCQALRHFRGVIGVEPHIHDIGDVVAEMRARQKLATAMYGFLKDWK